ICVSGTLRVAASATNLKLNLDIPHNQSGVTRTFLDLLAAGSTFVEGLVVGTQNVSGTWNIGAELCYPLNLTSHPAVAVKGVQILTHGAAFDRRYWDFAPGYSYVDSAVEHNWATLAYDRIGWGASDTPDPLNIVQFPLIIEICHALTSLLRAGKVGGMAFETVVGVGHSFGSFTTQAVTVNYPDDFDAVILTGYGTLVNGQLRGQTAFAASLNLAIANENQPYRFYDLPNGYLVPNTMVSNEFGFFYPPNYDPALLAQLEAEKYGLTWGEIFSSATAGGVTQDFEGPLAVVNGDHDLPECAGNCSYPTDQGELVKAALYPGVQEAKFRSLLVPESGHGINLHYGASAAYEWIMDFLQE
ncbi:hypothetical protein BAUCODRAFT_50440, partial [Baudoinia panamericana UAMH 10762]